MNRLSWLAVVPVAFVIAACSATTDEPTVEDTNVVSQALPKGGPGDAPEPPYNDSWNRSVVAYSYWVNSATCPYPDKPICRCNVYNMCACYAH